MIINGDWKNKVRTMRANGDNEGAKRELRKAKMMCYDKIIRDKDKFFIDYCLAHHSYKEGNTFLANQYLDSIKNIFDEDIKIQEMKLEYCNYLWLYVNTNYNNMNVNDIIDNMTEVFEYYNNVGEKDIALAALENIFRFKGEEDKILECLEELVNCDKVSDWNFIESILKDCEQVNHNLYIR